MSRTGDWPRAVARRLRVLSKLPPAMLGQPGHALCLYPDDAALHDVLERWVTEGHYLGQRTVTFATQDHLRALRQRLAVWDLRDDVEGYDAEQCLSRFMREGAPVRSLFEEVALGALKGRSSSEVRACDEMVAVLWQQGNVTAALMLEELWNAFLELSPVPLLCAYPQADVGSHPSAGEICRTHSRLHF